ncbi:TIGR03943 family protein [Bacillus albus]|uniref:TIGR03943 family putative permease subunit n=1 Tax=Bacillus TaxID=1386 RepID=UPI0014192522|nr:MULTISPECIES: TIGR03943 family protein [Bacillus cereus group]MBU5215898.1 TIGR03943 family protein [Bacillus albus]MDA2025144.1 TIGR03943 family protein [Bacillus cereus group sp. Bcc03]MDA2259471.1 TIGR03943 family protein [Bacillus cereus group sp. Bc200]MDA2320536.1 TIGR03943 family protein [Bacillus cereus group sp. Bc177]MDA2712161.1 TIGR03943 family protein [Bacillus cereus group sp. Bc025]
MEEQEQKAYHRYIRGIILIGLAMLLFKLLVTGNIYNFIAPKMIKFTYIAFVVILLLGSLQVWRDGREKQDDCNCCKHHTALKSGMKSFFVYVVFVVPIISAFLFGSVTIDGSLAGKRGMTQSVQARSMEKNEKEGIQANPDWQEQDETSNLKVTDQVEEQLEKSMLGQRKIQVEDKDYVQTMSIIGQDVKGFKGKEITFSGFIYNDKDVTGDKAVVARYGITCCIADASVWGMIVAGENVKKLPQETWVKITGFLDETTYKGTLFPLVKVNKVEKINKPTDPYVYDALPQ